MANLTHKSSVSVPKFGEWGKRKAVFMRDYSGHFVMIRSVRRYRKNFSSWTDIPNSDELLDQSSKPIKHPEEYRHFGELSSHRFNNQTHKSLAIGRFMRFLLCCTGH